MTYIEKLTKRITETGSNLCVGLDPRPDLMEGDLAVYLKDVVTETLPYVAAFKPNIAYFEQFGAPGMFVLEEVLRSIPEEVPVILDVKRSDIPETQKFYAKAYFDRWGVDAVTLNPYMGFDSIVPFAEYEHKGVYLLGVTSNPGSADLQMAQVNGQYVFERVVQMATRGLDYPAAVGLVLGLTNITPEVWDRIEDVPLLVPGLGAQGGDVSLLSRSVRKAPLLVNVSRSVVYGDPDTPLAERAAKFSEKIKKVMS